MISNPVNSKPSLSSDATIGALLQGNALPRLEATILLAHALRKTRESVLAHPGCPVAAGEAAAYAKLVGQRIAGVPIAYLTGTREFYGLLLQVTLDVLIPRPETELLVDWVLEQTAAASTASILDLGTGSGAIAVALAHHRPATRVEAVDVSSAAVFVARANAAAHGLQRIHIHRSDWYGECSGALYQIIVSNPPYVRARDPHLVEGDVRHEPELALVSGDDGLTAIRTIVAGAPSRLVTGGWLAFEHGYDQAEPCRALMRAAGFSGVITLRDLAGIERACIGIWGELGCAPRAVDTVG